MSRKPLAPVPSEWWPGQPRRLTRSRDSEALEEAMARVRRCAERKKAREAELLAMMREISAELEARNVVDELRAKGASLRVEQGRLLVGPGRLINGHAGLIEQLRPWILRVLVAET